jgi:hypothetical protein
MDEETRSRIAWLKGRVREEQEHRSKMMVYARDTGGQRVDELPSEADLRRYTAQGFLKVAKTFDPIIESYQDEIKTISAHRGETRPEKET